MHNTEAKQANIDVKRARDVARLEKEATATAQANAGDAQASDTAKYGAPPQPKKSRKRKAGTRSTRSNISKGGRVGRGGAVGGRGGLTWVAK